MPVPLPQANATLTQVAGAGLPAEYDRAATAGAVKWSGAADAYVLEERRRRRQGGSDDQLIVRDVILPALPVSLDDDDVLSIAYQGEAIEGRVAGVKLRALDGAPEGIRVTLRTG